MRDANFMLNRKLGMYWKLCWGVIVPVTLSFLFLYFLSTFTTLTYNDVAYPSSAIYCGILLVVVALIHVPIGAMYSYFTSEQSTFCSKMTDICTQTKHWGPLNEKTKNDWTMYAGNNNGGNMVEQLSLLKNQDSKNKIEDDTK